MLYTRSSFLTWLKDNNDCDIKPIPDSRVLIICNGPCSAKILVDSKNRIDYEEIWLVCNKLYLGLPGNNDLERIE